MGEGRKKEGFGAIGADDKVSGRDQGFGVKREEKVALERLPGREQRVGNGHDGKRW